MARSRWWVKCPRYAPKTTERVTQPKQRQLKHKILLLIYSSSSSSVLVANAEEEVPFVFSKNRIKMAASDGKCFLILNSNGITKETTRTRRRRRGSCATISNENWRHILRLGAGVRRLLLFFLCSRIYIFNYKLNCCVTGHRARTLHSTFPSTHSHGLWSWHYKGSGKWKQEFSKFVHWQPPTQLLPALLPPTTTPIRTKTANEAHAIERK